MNKTFYIFTYGCQMNKNDSEILAGLLSEEMDFSLAENPDDANVLIFNSCAVRRKAETRLFSRIQEFASLRKKHNRDQIIVLAGCVPQYEKEDIKERIPFVDYFIGPNSIDSLPKLLKSTIKSALLLNNNRNLEVAYDTTMRSKTDQAWISIMYGCNNFCSYCIVPYTRGREVSRPKENIFKEIKSLPNSYKKIILLGQNVNSYGKGLYDNYDFADLLNDISKLENIQWLSFLTSHPKDISEKLIKTIANITKCDKEIHFPIQSGDNEILKLMNRGYSREQYYSIVKILRTYIPDIKISTDLIVGFPGETEEQFQNTINAVKELNFYRINTAAYSPRKGTKAESMSPQLSEELKHKRLLELQSIVDIYAGIKKK